MPIDSTVMISFFLALVITGTVMTLQVCLYRTATFMLNSILFSYKTSMGLLRVSSWTSTVRQIKSSLCSDHHGRSWNLSRSRLFACRDMNIFWLVAAAGIEPASQAL